MLQIISGKFFTSDDRECHPGKGITYSNYSWIGPITTGIASIEPVYFSSSNVTPYVISYLNQIEKDGLLISRRSRDSSSVSTIMYIWT